MFQSLSQRLEDGVERAARSGRAVDALVLEDRLEDSILDHARDSVARDAQDPARAARDLHDLQDEWRRDKRAVDFISGLVGSSSGGVSRRWTVSIPADKRVASWRRGWRGYQPRLANSGAALLKLHTSWQE